ncbi:MAG TPA: dynamin family protein, partial [Actinomycetota bacterium]|nr:dynamin family protein [Actinomycetota bacterium]
MLKAATARSLHAALGELRAALGAARLDLDAPGAPGIRGLQRDLIAQIDDYLRPRLADVEAPVLVVVGGSTGAGKSTIVNSIVGWEISPAGVVRPTTRVPVLVCNTNDLDWFSVNRILPEFARRARARSDDEKVLRVVADEDLPQGVALLDAPDIDSVVRKNRELSSQLLAAADAWMFVVTAARYADAIPWDFLREAAERKVSLVVVLNRVPEEAEREVPDDLIDRLVAEGLEGITVFVVPESDLDDGLLPEDNAGPLWDWVNRLATSRRPRRSVVLSTLNGTLDSLRPRVEAVAAQIDYHRSQIDDIRIRLREVFNETTAELEEALSDGLLLRGEALARWEALLGSGQLTTTTSSAGDWLRDRVAQVFSSRPWAAEEAREAIEANFVTVLRDCLERGARAAWKVIQSSPAAALARDERELQQPTADLERNAQDQLSEWKRHVAQLVSDQSTAPQTSDRLLSLGVDGVSLALMLGALSEPRTHRQSAAPADPSKTRALLVLLFDEEGAQHLISQARRLLLDRVRALVQHERARYQGFLDSISPE